MFYAIRTQTDGTYTETQSISFYTKGHREFFLAKHPEAKAITSKENARLKTAGAELTISDKSLDCVYFSRTVR